MENHNEMNPTRKKDFLPMVDAAIEKLMGTNKLSVANVAVELNIHDQKLKRVIKSITGLGSSEYIKNYRVEYAKHLLIDHDMQSIANIGYLCGFEEPTNFIRFFKNATGITPGEFRRQESDKKK